MKYKSLIPGVLLILLLAITLGCSTKNSQDVTASAVNTSPASKTPEILSKSSPTPKKVNTFTRIPTFTPSLTPTITLTPTVTLTPMLLGTPLYNGEVITISNLNKLAKVAEWGRGSIKAVAFSPDQSKVVVGSEFGLAVYDMNNRTEPPTWRPFGTPFDYNQLFFSSDGKYILLEYYESSQVRDFETGSKIKSKEIVDWIRPTVESDYRDYESRSYDGSKVFRSTIDYGYVEEFFTEEILVREVVDKNGRPLYGFNDKVPYMEYDDRVEPEGCDLGVFSPCGNALMSLAMAPKKAVFSPNDETLAVLYNIPSLFDSDFNNILRVYDSEDGSFLFGAGGSETPIKDFAYSPDSRMLVTGHLDGSVRLWDIAKQKSTFGARHMSSEYLNAIAFTDNSKFFLVQRGDELEIRRAIDGELVSRSEATVFDLSPVNSNLIAVADKNNDIHIREIDSGDNILTLAKAHDDLIYTLTFSPDGRYLVTSGRDCDIKLWDLGTQKVLHHFEERYIDPYEIDWASRPFMYSMQFIPQTDLILGFGSWGTAAVWNVNSGALKYFIQTPPLDYYNGMITVKPHFSEYFKVDLENNRFFIDETGYDLDTGEVVSESATSSYGVPVDCSADGAYSSDGSVLITRGSKRYEGKLCVLNANDMKLISTIPVLEDTQDGYYVGWPFMSPDGKMLVVTTDGGIFFLYQVLP